jgi:hypothetical protein
MPRLVDPETLQAARRRKVDGWILTGLIVLSSLFAGAFLMYILYPAVTTVVGR